MMRKVIFAVFQRELLLAMRGLHELAQPLMFYVLVIALIPLAISPDATTLATLAPGIIWIGALLSTLLSLDRVFRSDFDDGALDQLRLCPAPLELVVLAKVIAHWLATGLPLLIVAPALAMLLSLPDQALGVLLISLALGTPVLSLVGAVGVALTVSVRHGGALLALLVLPLFVPVLIFGANAVAAASDALPVTGQLYMLAAFLVLSLTLAPLAAAAALRITTG
jgi:heme exporter protein B